ncbi:glycosyltransferase family 4 protein [Pararobbsia silviterrae]|uniref:Glycosyltransferase n=1 Tax=Pararobbsia silviterrae TaxID=1792498 RepID=A0A494XCX1_9BURK|nr:glycosyltransferase family 1 protein [Pararobbsia silviterrae]RKP47732.1 glycosyltransferase [Pararobbsia silviterrae]
MTFTFRIRGRRRIREANQARDARLWAQAAALYEAHVKRRPRDVAVVVQLANCLKEAGEHAKSLSFYERAIELSPTDADVFLQRGHLFKLMNRRADALASYRTALKHDADNPHAFRELLGMGEYDDLPIDDTVTTDEAVNTIWLDITDLIEYAKHNRSFSGIQRVVANLVRFAAQQAPGAFRVVPVVPDYARLRVLAVPIERVQALIDLFDTPRVERKTIDKAILAVYTSRYKVVPTARDAVVIAGAFWIYPHYDVIARLRKNGVRFGVFVHDLIPIKYPEYVHHGAIVDFQNKWVEVLGVTDFVLTNSEYVASEVKAYLNDTLTFDVPVKAVPLATELRERTASPDIVDPAIVDVCRHPFVLCVCTLEVRKNHLYLVKVWQRLRERFGENAPKLVFVGKWGWDVEELQLYLETLGCLDDWLHIFNGISDGALEYLYERCLFTAYVSFAEGFGLPIGESLVHGKPCIASSTTSMPEVGGRFARYVDPYDLDDGFRVFEQTLADRTGLEAWRDDIRQHFSPRTWNAFCADFYRCVETFHAEFEGAPAALNCVLPSAKIVRGGESAIAHLAATRARIVTFDAARCTGWSQMEKWGVWSVNSVATLEFGSDLEAGSDIQIYLRLRRPAGKTSTRLTVRCADTVESFRLAVHDTFIAFSGVVDADRRIRIELNVRRRGSDADVGVGFIALTAIAYFAKPQHATSLLTGTD